ncbi:MAG: TIGR02710 family CRISPR-associated protein [Fimbriimonadales bacterium]|nr:MAG: TIGR02710 family CRISPR-associated protein [Fimbriimonadales bacterium]
MHDTVLLLTVGGSCEPVVNAIRQTNPTFVYFICSSGPKGSEVVVDGAGKPCKERDKEDQPSIVQQNHLTPDQYEKVLLDDPDDLDSCFERIDSLSQQINQRFPNARVIANYTGGSKTMSVALAIVACQKQWDLQVNRGVRVDLVKVRAGTDAPARVQNIKILLNQYRQQARFCLDRYDYAGAELLLAQALQLNLSSGDQESLNKLRNYCKAFEHWDRFDYATAADLLESLRGKLAGKYLPALRKLRMETLSESGYWRVYDLLMNAERRAAQKRYDDAVARLYRAMEMLAQTRLTQAHQIDASDVDINRLPEHLREQYANRTVESNGKVQLALTRSYTLLSELGDSVGTLYKQKESQVLDAIRKRNYSYLAHGTEPIGETVYNTVRDALTEFIEQAIQAVSEAHPPRYPQLPQREIFEAL